jgi:aspartate racemase
MKTIGLLGGMSWESTAAYYSLINDSINAKLGKNHSSSCLVYSFDFQEIEELQYAGMWDELEARMIEGSRSLKAAGAECIVVCTNTMHKVVDRIEAEVGIPLLHIADAIGEAIARDEKKRIGLLGTIFTMEEDFYRRRLETKYGLEIVIPSREDRAKVNKVIYEELVKGIISESSRADYLRIMDAMKGEGVEGIILGCTEIGLLIDEYPLPLYDSTIIHAAKAVDFSLGL